MNLLKFFAFIFADRPALRDKNKAGIYRPKNQQYSPAGYCPYCDCRYVLAVNFFATIKKPRLESGAGFFYWLMKS